MTIDRSVPPERLERFRRRIASNAAGWLGFIRQRGSDVAGLELEFANLTKSVSQALLEPLAFVAGLDLVVALWPFVELRGYWLGWERVLQEALVVCRSLDRPAVEAQLLDQLGDLARIVGDSRSALAWQEQSLTIYRRLDDPANVGRVLDHLSLQHLALGDRPAAERCSREAVDLFAQTGNQANLAAALNNRGLICQQGGQWELAIQHHADAAALYEALGNRRGQAKAIHNQGEAYRHLRRPDDAEACFRQAVAMLADAGDEINAARSRVILGVALRKRADRTSPGNAPGG